MEQLDFLDNIWGNLEGYACVHTVEKGKHKDHFFQWPDQRALVQEVLLRLPTTNDVYFSPALFSEPARKKSSVKVAQVAWADWDDGLSGGVKDNPPMLVVHTSPTKYHTYWATEPTTSVEVIEQRNKAFGIGADKCWSAEHLFRVPGHVNQKNGWTTRLHELSDVDFLAQG